MFRPLLVAASALALAACGKAATESDNPHTRAEPAAAGSAAAGAGPSPAEAAPAPASFVQCKTCHSVEPGRNGIGPSLAGIHGRKAGTVPGYAYSTAMKMSGLTWDDSTLDRFLEAPRNTVPGTKMVYAGQGDPAKRAELIAYLKNL